MKQQVISLSGKTKGVIIPNTVLKQLENPEAFNMEIKDGKLILEPLEKKGTSQKAFIDESLDLYKVD